MTVELILNHKSIRAWKETPIEEKLMETLFEAANRTSTSNGMQNASIIRVKDSQKREMISEVAGQKYVTESPELLIFIVDNYRNYRIVEEQGQKENFANDTDRFFQGFTDACLMAQNLTIAAESMGLGIVYYGSILNDARKIIEILELPKNTFPVVGLGLGYPNQNPELKPRMSIKSKVFTDRYEVKDNYLEELKSYDEEMRRYYDLRNPNQSLDPFTIQVAKKNSAQMLHRSELFEIIKEQGFNVSY